MEIKKADVNDSPTLAKLAVMMWNSHTADELEQDFSELLRNESSACFIKYCDGNAVGFAQCQLRTDYVEGTSTSPVGYLEGVFILEEFRRRGIASELVKICEQWVKEKGCTEFASDCELENSDSFMFHKALGFEEANRIICFKKSI